MVLKRPLSPPPFLKKNIISAFFAATMDIATCSLFTCNYLQGLFGFVAHLWIDLIRNILEKKITVERYVGSLER